MASTGFYDPVVFLHILEILSGLLIVSTVIKRFKSFEKLTEGSVLIVIAGLLIIGSSLYSLLVGMSLVLLSLFDTIIFLFFSLGLLYLSKHFKLRSKVKRRAKTSQGKK